MTIGGPYKWKPQDGPGPGYYESDRAADSIKTSSPSARMDKRLVSMRGSDPSPQVYDGHHKMFGADVNGFTIGLKDKWKAKDGPGPGEYDPDRADSQTRQRSPAARIDQDTMVAIDTIQVYQSSSKLNVSTRKRQSAPIPEEQSEETPSPQKIVPKQIDDSTKSASPLKQGKF